MSLLTGVTILRNDGTAAYEKCWTGPWIGSNKDYYVEKHFKFHDVNDKKVGKQKKTQNYAAILFDNRHDYKVPPHGQCGAVIKEFYEKKESISVVAIGPGIYFAVVTEDGDALFHGTSKFIKKMESIDTSKIKHISFGCDNQWAITMKNGHCHGWLNPGILSY